MQANEIADLITAGMRGPTGPDDAGFYTGQIKSWDPLTGANVVTVNQVDLTNLKSLQSGIANSYTVGDTVVVIRKQTQYFVMGRVASAGGSAGSAPVSSNTPNQDNMADTAGAWVDIAHVGPTVNAYIGNSHKALLIWSFDYVGFQSVIEMGWQISGASNLAPGTYSGSSVKTGFSSSVAPTITIQNTVTGTYVAAQGYFPNVGLHTIQAKYRCQTFDPGPVLARCSNRNLTVIPL